MKWEDGERLAMLGAFLEGNPTESEAEEIDRLLEEDPYFFRLYLQCLDAQIALKQAETPVTKASGWVKARIVSVAAVLLISIGAFMLFQFQSRNKSLAKFELKRSLGSCQLQQGSVTAGSLSFCDVSFVDGARIRTFPNTLISFQNLSSESVYKIERGHILLNSDKQQRQKQIRISLNNFQLKLVGTTLEILTEPPEVRVIDGAVEVNSDDGECHEIVEAGKSFRLTGKCGSIGKVNNHWMVTPGTPSGIESLPDQPVAFSRAEAARLFLEIRSRDEYPVCRVAFRDGIQAEGIVFQDEKIVYILEADGNRIERNEADVVSVTPLFPQ